jgi:GntR family transcriptional regulator
MDVARRKAAARNPGEPMRPDARPLYAQVREILTERIRSGAWAPGAALPSEFEIAHELGVSQGTVRKALDAMTADHLLVRRQGRGTFVIEHTPASMLFRFFNFFDASGAQVEPDSRAAEVSEGTATRAEAARLALTAGARVARITRTRTWKAQPIIAETIVVPALLFPGLAQETALPNTLYDYYQRRFGVMVSRAEERITAIAAPRAVGRLLDVASGAPLLRVDRLMHSLDGARVEWRVSLCRVDSIYYLARIG